MKILLAVDGSPYTKRMLAYLAAHDELLGAANEFTVFTAVAPIPPHAAEFVAAALLSGYYAEQAEAVLAPIRAFIAQQGWTVRYLYEAGRAPDRIAALADRHDLLVMGSHGHSALGNMVLGSVATRVLAQSRTPVLLVR